MVHLVGERVWPLGHGRGAHCERNFEVLHLIRAHRDDVFLTLAVMLDKHGDLLVRPHFELYRNRRLGQLFDPNAEVESLAAVDPRLKLVGLAGLGLEDHLSVALDALRELELALQEVLLVQLQRVLELFIVPLLLRAE